MGLKKYEIITVGGVKRVRALRSWQVGDRYVNIGDVGGIVYDEKTLSQDGACWLFKGNFGFPGARIGGDSIVDVGEAAIDANGSSNVDILGSSVVVGSKVNFTVGAGAVDGVTLLAADFEQGGFNAPIAGNPLTGSNSANYIRLKKPIFAGGKPFTLKCAVPGYIVTAVVVDRDGLVIANTLATATGAGVTITVPAGQYFSLTMTKDPAGPTVPADGQTAKITFTVLFDTKLVVVDSRLEVNPVTSTGTVSIRSGGFYSTTPGASYPDSVIRNSKVVINGHATANRMVRLISDFIGCNVTIDATSGDSQGVGIYSNVNNLTFTGLITSNWNEAARSSIQAYDCDNFAVSSTIFPGLTAAQTANMPFIFQGCNVPNGIFYHHTQIANTYRDINFDLATKDLGKTFDTNRVLVSSEVNGMYRAWFATDFGALIESYESVKSLTGMHLRHSYNTTIYADAYLNGAFGFVGTNVFGNTMKHDASNTQNVMVVQGSFNASVSGQTITGIVSNTNRCVAPTRFRVNGSQGIIVNVPAGIECYTMFTDANGTIQSTGAFSTGVVTPASGDLKRAYAYLLFKKVSGDPITPDEVKGVTVTTYNGCRIVNTKATAAVITGNVRVEDNATLIDTSVTGTGYFGGNSIIQAPSALVGQLPIVGAAYMSDNAVFAPSVANASAEISSLEMKDSAVFAGPINIADTKCNITMANNAQFLGGLNTSSGFVMRGNSFVAAAASVSAACRGLLTMRDDARIESGNITAIGHITLCGKYTQTANKTWTGERVIGSQDEPTYGDNVKTKYDF